jgi:hypothetical protein
MVLSFFTITNEPEQSVIKFSAHSAAAILRSKAWGNV